MTVLAISNALQVTIALIAIFGVVFPAIVHVLIGYAVFVARGERLEDEERRHFSRVARSR
jgi:K+-transporting ATPase c subunit